MHLSRLFTAFLQPIVPAANHRALRQAHVTLARRARGLIPQPAPPLRWTAQRYALVHSDHGYHPLQHYG